jgi:hypothetical protein
VLSPASRSLVPALAALSLGAAASGQEVADKTGTGD